MGYGAAQVKIICSTTFLDGRRRFEKDDSVTVPDEDGQRFVEAGWAVVAGDEVLPLADAQPVDLDVQNGVSGVSSAKVG